MSDHKTNILFISTRQPDPNSGGGFHRTYQIYDELVSAFGKESIHIPALQTPQKKETKLTSIKQAARQRSQFIHLALRSGAYQKAMVDEILVTNQSSYNLFKSFPIDTYDSYLDKHGRPDLCVADNCRYLPIIEFNLAHNIQTIFCPQNLDSLDLSAHLLADSSHRKQCGISFIYELDALTKSIPLLTSKMEISMMDALGIPSVYFPYLPVGEIKDRLLEIRTIRQRNRTNPNLFLMVASINHTTTYEGYKWFFKNVLQYGLPPDIEILVGGWNSDVLGNEFPQIRGVKFLGKLDQPVLDEYMESALAVLIPQLSGFGSVTRIPEMSCAGIPMIVSQHALKAINTSPGVYSAQNEWSEWVHLIDEIKSHKPSVSHESYDTWEAEQPRPLIDMIKHNLKG